MFSKLPLRTEYLRTVPRAPLRSVHKSLPENVVKLMEVGPRDGLQNEPKGDIISTNTKVALINRLVAAGVMNVEVGSFVRPELVPQVCIYII